MQRKKAKSSSSASSQGPSGKELLALQTALAEIMAESWRFELALEKALRKMDPMEAERFSRQYSYFSSRVSQAVTSAGLVCLDLTGQPYDAGMAVQAMNLEDFDEDESLIIIRMIEPVILCSGRVMKTGMVMLGRMAGEE